MNHARTSSVVVAAAATVVGAFFVAGAAACGPASVEGSILGESFQAADAVLVDDALLGVVVVISTGPSLCGQGSDGTRQLHLAFVDHDGTGAELAPGSGDFIAVSQSTHGKELLASYLIDNGAGGCIVANAVADDGVATIEALSASSASGTFDISFGKDRVKGNFSAPACPTASFHGIAPCDG